jgi:hypothetical protein
MRPEDPIDVYLDELAGYLEGSRHRRRRILDEVGTHLRDAVDADARTHSDPVAAARRAIDRFGTAHQTAGAFELTAAEREQSRRARKLITGASVLGAATVMLVLALTSGHRAVSPHVVGGVVRYPPGTVLVAAGTSPAQVSYRLAGESSCVTGGVRSGRVREMFGASVRACAPLLAPELPRRFVSEVCSGRVGIHLDARSPAGQTLRITLANGVAVAVPESSVLASLAQRGSDLVLFASSPRRQPVRVEVLASSGRALSRVSGHTFSARLPGMASMFGPPQIAVAGALTDGGPLFVSLRQVDSLKGACARESRGTAPLGPAA